MERQVHEGDHRVVLIAEEDPATARVMMGWMAQAGHDVIWAFSAADAVALAHRRDPDVAIVCPRLGDAGGPGVVRSLREHRSLRRLPVVTVHPDAGSSFTAEALGERVQAAVRAA
jgi:DNA-binding response OmpR family regulator